MNRRDLDAEALRATEMLRGKTVRTIWRHRDSELGIDFADGTRLFIDAIGKRGLELSITPSDDSVKE